MKLKKIHFVLIITALIQCLDAQNTNPIVSNISFVNNIATTGKVDIYYDVTDAEQANVNIALKVSNDGGVNYGYSCTQVTGDIGAIVAIGTNKHIVWDFNTEHPGESGDNYKVEIIANDETADGSPCPGTETINYAGKIYNTIQIGGQCWMKENLDVGTMINSTNSGSLQTDNDIIEKYCYDNDTTNCNTYGGLYEWDEAMQYSTTEGTKGICPNGWHIPTMEEYGKLDTLVNYSGDALKAVGQGTGNNTSGFSTLLSGSRIGGSGAFNSIGIATIFWSSNASGSIYPYYLYLFGNNDNVSFYNYLKNYGYCVRCIKNN